MDNMFIGLNYYQRTSNYFGKDFRKVQEEQGKQVNLRIWEQMNTRDK